MKFCSSSKVRASKHTHTHTHMYVRMCVCVRVCFINPSSGVVWKKYSFIHPTGETVKFTPPRVFGNLLVRSYVRGGGGGGGGGCGI